MAIKSKYNQPIKIEGKYGQIAAPSFRATKQGLAVVHNSRFVADSETANGCLEIPDFNGAGHLKKIYLFVTRVSTSWTISGMYGQAEKSRTWYPRNLAQNEFVIEGQMPDQHHYDLLVEFVEHHQRMIVGTADETVTSRVGNFTKSALFSMWPQRKPTAIPTTIFSPEDTKLMIGVVITSIKAGHERFQFSPAFSLTCKVVEDRLHEDQEVTTDIMDKLDYVEIFGKTVNAVAPTTGEFSSDVPAATGRKQSRRVKISDGSTATLNRGVSTPGAVGGGGPGIGPSSDGCDRAVVFPGYEGGGYTSDTDYMNKNNPAPGGEGSNYKDGTTAPVKYPKACQGGGDDRHDLSYTKSSGGRWVDGAGNNYDDKGRKT